MTLKHSEITRLLRKVRSTSERERSEALAALTELPAGTLEAHSAISEAMEPMGDEIKKLLSGKT